jgi:2,4-dienoyl-CoA reductase-like NADH-dependent reductase (Old Yellow Enzyme family)
LKLAEIRDVAAEVLRQGRVDYLDMSLWDVAKEPEEEAFKGRSLMSYFTDLSRGSVKLGAAGKIGGAEEAASVLAAGCDFVVVGRAAILRHDFPERVQRDPHYVSPSLPVTVRHLADEGLGPRFIDYMRTWAGFVADEEVAA